MPRYLVTQTCQEPKERQYRWRKQGEIVDLPLGARVPEPFKLIEYLPGEEVPVEKEKPKKDPEQAPEKDPLDDVPPPPPPYEDPPTEVKPKEPETLYEIAKIQEKLRAEAKDPVMEASRPLVEKKPTPKPRPKTGTRKRK